VTKVSILNFIFSTSGQKKEKRRKKTGNEGEKNHRKQEHTRSKYRRMKFNVALSIEDSGLGGTVNLAK